MKKTHAVKQILKKQEITSWFQPIVDTDTRALLGWEAFSKGPSVGEFENAPSLFDSAAEAGVLKPFDLMCLHSAATCFEQLQLEQKLFVNLSNEMLIASGKLKEQVSSLIVDNNVPPTRMVLEIDERSACQNIDALIEAAHSFHEQGFEIAIDDLDLSNMTHRLWSELKPDYVKIDRRFISNINGHATHQKFVRNIVAAARSINAKVIAEGVETHKELKTLQELGITIIQGFIIQKPELAPVAPDLNKIFESDVFKQVSSDLACDLVVSQEKVAPETLIQDVLALFDEKVFLSSIAVIEKQKIVGMVHRNSFMAKLATRQRRDVLLDKPISSEMETEFLSVDSHVRIEQVSRLVTARARLKAEQDFVITNLDKFLGIGTPIDLLRKVTQLRVEPSRQANLLTMLPGNVPVADCINYLLDKGHPSTVALLDLTSFKPFNNHYGHNKGDEILVVFADMLRKHISEEVGFAGHIGGDDFIVVIRHGDWKSVLSSLFNEFEHRVISFYNEQDQAQGGIESTDRFGEARFFEFVSLSAGVMSITDEYFDSFQSLLTKLIQLKQRTKRDSALQLAMQHKNKISLYSFKKQFKQKSSETVEP